MIVIRFEYQNNSVVIPVNPENIEISRSNNNTVTEVIGLGEIVIPQSPKLAEITISSFFYQRILDEGDYQFKTTKEYADWFKIWSRSKLPAQWVVESKGGEIDFRLLGPLQVICESFSYDLRAGEEEDIYYELTVKEYRPYTAKVININTSSKTALPTSEVRTNNSPPVQKTYTVRNGDTLASITLRLGPSGSDWRGLYELNKKIIGDNSAAVRVGDVYVLPDSWVTAKS